MDGTLIDLGGGKWRCRVSFVAHGKRHQKSSTYQASGKKEARRIMREFKAECVQNATPTNLKTLSDLYNIFVKFHSADVQPATMVFYENMWKNLADYHKMKLSAIKPNEIKTMLSLAPLKSRKRKGIYQLLSAMYNYAVDSELLNYNPCKKVKAPQYSAPEKPYLSAADKELIDENIAVEAQKYQVMYYLTLYLGFRRQEICALKWSDFNFRNKTLTVNRTATLVKGEGTVVKPLGKNDDAKSTLPITDSMIEMLQKYKNYSFFEKKRLEINTDYLFYQNNGDVMSLSTPTHWFKSFCERLGINTKITLHSVRHTCATDILHRGVDIATVAAILRDSVETVVKTYIHTDEHDKRAAVEGNATKKGKKREIGSNIIEIA